MFSINNKVRFMSVMTIFVMLFSLASISPAIAAGTPGSLDTTFGIDGKAIVDFGGDEDAPAMILDESGRIILVGFAGNYPNFDFGVARLNPDASPDTSFGTNGYTVIDFGGMDLPYAIEQDNSGRILVAGLRNLYTPSIGWSSKIIVARLNEDGTLDTSFGNGGKVIFGIGGRKFTDAYAMKIDALGRILLAGSSRVFVYSTEYYDVYNSDITVVRLNPDGTIDQNFGEYGWAQADFGTDEGSMAMALDESGRMVIAALSDAILVTRLNSDGTLDTSFGQDGQATFDFGGDNYPTAIALDHMGRIVVIGAAINFDYTDAALAVARYNSDGSPDTTFGVGGHTTIDFGGMDFFSSLALDEAGHIIITGNIGDDVDSDFAVVQLNEDGTFDTNFDGDGVATIDFGGSDRATAITLDGADHILLAGATDVGGTLDFAFARLNASPISTPMIIQGFYQPVEMDGVWNTVKGGSTVPLQFEVFDGEIELTDPAIVNQPLSATQALCDGGSTEDVELLTTGETSLRYDDVSGQFVYNWKTPKKPGYCYVVTVTLEDGTSLSANFKLK